MNAAAAVTIFGSNGRAVCAHLLITYSFQKKQIVLPSSAFEAEPPDLSHKKKNFNINTILNMLMEEDEEQNVDYVSCFELFFVSLVGSRAPPD